MDEGATREFDAEEAEAPPQNSGVNKGFLSIKLCTMKSYIVRTSPMENNVKKQYSYIYIYIFTSYKIRPMGTSHHWGLST